jgi:hypothetical protein
LDLQADCVFVADVPQASTAAAELAVAVGERDRLRDRVERLEEEVGGACRRAVGARMQPATPTWLLLWQRVRPHKPPCSIPPPQKNTHTHLFPHKIYQPQVSSVRQRTLDEAEAERQELRQRLAALASEVEEAQALSAAAAKSLLEAQKTRSEAVERVEQVGCVGAVWVGGLEGGGGGGRWGVVYTVNPVYCSSQGCVLGTLERTPTRSLNPHPLPHQPLRHPPSPSIRPPCPPSRSLRKCRRRCSHVTRRPASRWQPWLPRRNRWVASACSPSGDGLALCRGRERVWAEPAACNTCGCQAAEQGRGLAPC